MLVRTYTVLQLILSSKSTVPWLKIQHKCKNQTVIFLPQSDSFQGISRSYFQRVLSSSTKRVKINEINDWLIDWYPAGDWDRDSIFSFSVVSHDLAISILARIRVLAGILDNRVISSNMIHGKSITNCRMPCEQRFPFSFRSPLTEQKEKETAAEQCYNFLIGLLEYSTDTIFSRFWMETIETMTSEIINLSGVALRLSCAAFITGNQSVFETVCKNLLQYGASTEGKVYSLVTNLLTMNVNWMKAGVFPSRAPVRKPHFMIMTRKLLFVFKPFCTSAATHFVIK